ncbi:MAG: ribose-phosphate pyrophosphokinase-like domain-containing protein, partial [Ruminococcus sp.]
MTASEVLFNQESSVAPVGIIAMESAKELGGKINDYLVDWAKKGGNNTDTFLIEAECPRFSSGDGKGYIKSTVRGKDLYIIVDVGNYNCKYKLFSRENCMSPDDHYQDLKRIIQAASGKAHRITVIMPILYGGRQHRRNYRESLDCAWALQELERMGVSNIITFDAHDPRVQNAVPLMGIDNVMPTYQVLKSVIKNIKDIQL